MAFLWEKRMAEAGGIAAVGDLRQWGLTDQDIRVFKMYRALIVVRRGWYSLPTTESHIIEACRWGGRVACVSALRHHGLDAFDDGRLHVELPANAVVRRDAGTRATVRLHWARSPSAGDRAVVDVTAARRQALACRA